MGGDGDGGGGDGDGGGGDGDGGGGDGGDGATATAGRGADKYSWGAFLTTAPQG